MSYPLHEKEAREQAIQGRSPVGITGGSMPIVACRDGSIWQLVPGTLADGEDPDRRTPERWEQLPSIPGSRADMTHSYWTGK